MNIAEVRYWSPSLDRWALMTALIPPGRGPFPVLYLLHGLGGDHRSWLTDYALCARAERLRAIIILPDGGRGYYVDDPRPAGLGRNETHLACDTVKTVDRMFPTRTEPGARAVAGMSMGGYGAIMLALRHPELFGQAAGLSASLYFAHRPHPRDAAFQTELAGTLPGGAYDCFALVRRFPVPENRPRLWLAVGADDPHAEINRAFHEELTARGWTHGWTESPGAHDRAFWSDRLPDLLEFVREGFSPSGE